MDINNLKGLMEAYQQVNAPEQIGEASRADEFTRAAISRSSGRKGGITFEPGPNWDPSANRGKGAHLSPKQKEKQRRKALRQEQLDIFDIVLEFLQVEGYAETLEEAEWMMANLIDEEAVAIILGEEQLDELSNRTVSNALNARIAATGAASDRAYKHRNPQAMRAAETAADKEARMKGAVARRRARMNKEDFESWIDEAMSNYEKNRKRAAQRAAARNEARKQGKTGAVPGVGYVTPKPERETWTDESGKTRHAKGL